jgi:hypothetical protein
MAKRKTTATLEDERRSTICTELAEWGEGALVGDERLRMPTYVNAIAKDTDASMNEIARLYREFDHLNSVGHGSSSRAEAIAGELEAIAKKLCAHVKASGDGDVKRYWRAREKWIYR